MSDRAAESALMLSTIKSEVTAARANDLTIVRFVIFVQARRYFDLGFKTWNEFYRSEEFPFTNEQIRERMARAVEKGLLHVDG